MFSTLDDADKEVMWQLRTSCPVFEAHVKGFGIDISKLNCEAKWMIEHTTVFQELLKITETVYRKTLCEENFEFLLTKFKLKFHYCSLPPEDD